MTSRTHIVQMNGASRGPLVDSIRPYADQLTFSLNRMNGTSFWAYSLWRAPDDADLLDDIPLSDTYLQCAGAADAMTVEVRIVDSDGTARQLTVGKPDGEPTAEATEVIWWDDARHSTSVQPHEVFTADEAADVFHAYFLTDEVPAPYVLRELDLSPAAATELRSRALVFSDDNDAEETWAPGDAQPAGDAFWDFVSRRLDDDNVTFYIEDDEHSEALLLMLGAGVISRARAEPTARGDYRIVTDEGDYEAQVENFVRGGFAALDRLGPWWPDVPSLMRARLRLEFDGSALRRTHLSELRHRLAILTRIDGREPTTVEAVTHYGYADGDGSSVNAWLVDDGRGLLVTFDRTGAVASNEAAQHTDLYAGVPTDLLALVRDAAREDPALNVTHPDGRSGLPATGVFHLSGTWAMADGLVAFLQESQLGIGDTGVDRLLGTFLELDDFGPQTVEQAGWWDARTVESGFADA